MRISLMQLPQNDPTHTAETYDQITKRSQEAIDQIVKETEEKGIGECIIAKQRNGPVGTVKMAWIGAHSKFADLELVHKE